MRGPLGVISSVTTKRQRRTVGSIVQVALGDGTYCYAQTLEEPEFAFFDVRHRLLPQAREIVAKPLLFRLWVMNHAVTGGRWLNVGKAPVTDDLARPVPRFKQDALDPSRFEIYLNGNSRPATVQECVGLERAAVWDPEHVEDRLRDHYAGRPNRWVESLRLKLS